MSHDRFRRTGQTTIPFLSLQTWLVYVDTDSLFRLQKWQTRRGIFFRSRIAIGTVGTSGRAEKPGGGRTAGHESGGGEDRDDEDVDESVKQEVDGRSSKSLNRTKGLERT